MYAVAESADERRRSRLAFLGLVLGLLFGGAALYLVAGPPRLPPALPSWDTVALTLRGSDPPLAAIGYLLTTAAWAVWLWLVVSIVLRLLALGAEAATRGATWARALRVVSDRFTLPIVRRVVDGALVVVFVVNIAARPTPSAAAPLSEVVVAAEGPRDLSEWPSTAPSEDGRGGIIEYTVQAGDTLWAIAERFYGTGAEFPRLVAANAGRAMPDDGRFTRAGVIRPGWVLEVPGPSRAVDNTGGTIHYTVQCGDTLRGISARLLGDEGRWNELFQLNQGVARLADGRVLDHPNLIWPGLRLQLPAAEASAAAPPPGGPPTIPSEPPSPVPEPSPTPLVPGAPTPPPAPDAVIATPTSVPAPVAQSDHAAATPTPIPTASPGAEAITAELLMVSTPETVAAPRSAENGSAALLYGAVGLGALGAGAFLLRRRLIRRSLAEPPVRHRAKRAGAGTDGFAEAAPARALSHRLQGGEDEPAVLVAAQTLRFLEENEGPSGPRLLSVRHGRGEAALTFDASLIEQEHLIELAGPLGARLGGVGRAGLSADHDVVLKIAGLKMVNVLPPPGEPMDAAPSLVPLAALPDGSTLYANFPTLGHVLIAGVPGGGTEIVLTSLIASLAARCRPHDLRLWTIASRRALRARLGELPHQSGGIIDPSDDVAVEEVLATLLAELVRRMQLGTEADADAAVAAARPTLVLASAELAELRDDGTTLELLGQHGSEYGIQLVAATTRAAAVGDLAGHFATRLVLQLEAEEESVRLLGQPDAADLGAGGDLFLRIAGRQPLRARGFRLPDEHLDQLVHVMADWYGVRAGGSSKGSYGRERNEAGQPPDALSDDALSASADDEAPLETPRPDEEVSAGAPDGEAVTAGVEEPEVPDPPRMATRSIAPDQFEPGGSAEGSSSALAFELGGGTSPIGSLDTPSGTRLTPEPAPGHQHAGGKLTSVAVAAANGAADASQATDEPLVRVELFGGFRVTSGGRELSAAGEEGAQYKPWELLAFLAAQPNGAVSRERLLAALWPDVDVDRATNRMRVAMARLRAVLAEQVPGLTADVVRAERDGICRLDTRVVASDVQEFLARCREGARLPAGEAERALELARELYRGDLLSGGAARTYEWVDERDEGGLSPRERCREACNRATVQLARLYREQGRPDCAIPLYRALLRVEPTLEDVARELYRCYADIGDRTALVREHRHLRQALREALADPDDPEDDGSLWEPQPETVAVYKEILAELEARAAQRRGAGQAAAAEN